MSFQCLFVLLLLLSVAYGQDRVLTAMLNPLCVECDSSTTLLYVKGQGAEDTIHQIWDFSRGAPTVIYAVGNRNSSMLITWTDGKPISFLFTGTLMYSFAAEIDKLYDYQDCRDIGHLDNKCPRKALPLNNVSWRLKSSVMSEQEVMISMHGLYKDHGRSGILDMKLDVLPFTDYAKDLPHLIHTANSTLIDINLVNFTSPTNVSRYAIHFVMVSTDSSNEEMVYTMRKSLDDEHTPGVFEIIEVRTPRSNSSGTGGFMQFRPVGYTESERSVSSSTNAYISTINRTSLSSDTTMGKFYMDFKPAQLLVQDMFISFGLPGDGYYKQHNFTSWSYSFGYGSPPVESVSTFVIVIIALGLGVPVLLALSGITYVIVRKHRQNRNQPERFIDDDDE